MRVNVDDVAFMDPRFKLLGGRLGMTWQEALGRCLPVWALAYAKRSAVLRAGDVDALGERPGFAAEMIAAELAIAESEGVYLCGVTERIDFLLLQDAKREQARQARAAAAGVKLPAGRSRGKAPRDVEAPGDGPGGASRGRVSGDVPGEGPYSPDLAPDLAPDDLSPSRAIPPSTERAAAPVAPAPSVEPDLRPSLEARQEIRGQIWRELGEARVEVATELGLPAADHGLMAFDPGERALANRLALASNRSELELIAQQARKAIAVVAAEARAGNSLEYLTGVVFENDRVWRRAIGKSLDEATRPRAGPRSSPRHDQPHQQLGIRKIPQL